MKIDRLFLGLIISTSVWGQSPTTTSASSVVPNATSTSVLTAEKKDEKFVTNTGAVKITTLGRMTKDEDLNSTVGWSFIELGVESKYFEWLKFSFNIAGVLGEGAAQNYLSGDGGTANALMIDSIGLELTPIKQLSLKAGVIGYKINPLVTHMSAGTSLGAEQSLNFANNSETLKLSFIGNEAIPSTGVTKGMVEENKNPFFISGSVQGEAKVTPLKTTFKAAATQFKFGNLPNSAAEGALVGGNSINSISGTGEQMHYAIGFSGIETAGVIETEWTSKITTILKAAMIENEEVIEQNKGAIGGISAKIRSGNLIFKPGYSIYRVEADTTPSGYSIFPNRFNNRNASRAVFEVELEKQKLSLFGVYTKADVLVESPFMSDRETYNLGVEVNYDLF